MLTDLLKSGVSSVFVEAEEPLRVKLPELDFEIKGAWSPIDGLILKCGISQYKSAPKNKDIESALEYLLVAKTPHYCVFYLGDQEVDIGLVERVANTKHTVVYIGKESFGSITTYKYPDPSFDEYKELFEKILRPKKNKKLVEKCALYSIGMKLKEAENCFRYSYYTNTDFLKNKSQFVTTSILDFVNEGFTFNELGGFKDFKKWFRKRAYLYRPENKEYNDLFPRGVIFTGEPGCGKSRCCKCLGNESGLPLIRLDISKVYNQYVGNSERELRQALDAVERISPCILWIEELGRIVVGRNSGSDSGTTSRLISMLLFWLQEHKKNIFTAATVNDYENLPPELTRKGRFSKVWFVNKPTIEESKEILDIHCARHGLDIRDTLSVAKQKPQYTGADLEALVEDTIIECYNKGNPKSEITAEHLIRGPHE